MVQELRSLPSYSSSRRIILTGIEEPDDLGQTASSGLPGIVPRMLLGLLTGRFTAGTGGLISEPKCKANRNVRIVLPNRRRCRFAPF